MILTYATCFQHIDLLMFHFCLFVHIVLIEAGGMMTSTMDKPRGLWLWGAIPPLLVETDNINRSSSYLPNKNGTFNLVNIEKLERVNALIKWQVLRIACGNENIMALVKAENGLECFNWGSNCYEQLGLGHSEPCLFHHSPFHKRGTKNWGLTHHTSHCCTWVSLRIGNQSL